VCAARISTFCPTILGVVTSAKNARLDELAWLYPDSVEQQAEWLRACVRQANAKGAAIAEALGTKIVGIHKVTEQPFEEVARRLGASEARRLQAREPGFPPYRSASSSPTRSVPVSRITVEYRVEGFRRSEA